MSRLPTAALTLAAVLVGRAAAKPPDLPLPQNDVLAPAVPAEVGRPAPPDLFPPEAPAAPEPALFFRVRPSVRRTMASCLLFGANPLLALAPTEEYVDFDEEDAPAAFFDLFGTLTFEESRLGSLLIGVGVNEEVAPNWSLKWANPAAALALASGEALEPSSGPFPGQPAGPDDQTSPCPWMNQRSCVPGRPMLLSADVDLSHDVLDNLEMLRQAHGLLQDARELGREGRTWEALESLQLARDLCPNAWLDEKVQDVSAEILGSSFTDNARAAFQPCLPPVDPQMPAALDGLYPETSPPAAAPEENPPDDDSAD